MIAQNMQPLSLALSRPPSLVSYGGVNGEREDVNCFIYDLHVDLNAVAVALGADVMGALTFAFLRSSSME